MQHDVATAAASTTHQAGSESEVSPLKAMLLARRQAKALKAKIAKMKQDIGDT